MAETLPLLGRLAVHLKLITMDQLAEATSAQGRPGEEASLGEILVRMGFLSPPQLEKLLAAQKQIIAKQRAARAAASAGGARSEPQVSAVETASATGARPQAAAGRAQRGEAERSREGEPEASGVGKKGEPGTAAASAPSPPAAPAPSGAETPSRPAQPAAPQAEARPAEGPAPIASSADLAQPSAADREALLALLHRVVEQRASDLHLHAGAPPALRIGERLEAAGEPLERERVERMVMSVLDPQQRALFATRGELDVCHGLGGIGRFRANLYRQQRGVDGVFRFIPAEPPTLDELSLPARLAKLTNYHQGMVLVTGPTSCGKSSTLAALVNLINEERHEHVLCIEDPIEYVHPSKRCLVNQRSVGSHTESFARALRAALREDPAVIVIGELRDLETVSLALTAAETGHFVLATLHTNNAIRTVNRLVGAFPADQQDQVRAMLSESLRAVVSQRLLQRADGAGRVPALETLIVTKAVGNLIRENKTFQIHSILQTGASQGMALLDHSIRELVASGVVSVEEAQRHAEDPKALAA